MQKILLVEDEENLNRVVQDYLRHNGFDAVSAHSGYEGFLLWRSDHPDMILLDLNLPDIDGLDLLLEVRKKAQVPVIVITARIEEVDRLIGLQLGADDYITKLFSLREAQNLCSNFPISPEIKPGIDSRSGIEDGWYNSVLHNKLAEKKCLNYAS